MVQTRLLHVASTASLALAPLLVLQGQAVRRNAPLLPGAAGPTTGAVAGLTPALRLLVIGESTVAGVGAPTHAEALTGQLATALAARLGRAVLWRAAGENGATASAVRHRLVPALPVEPFDAVLITLGVNDTLRLRSPTRWAVDLTVLVDALRERVGPARIFLAATPPMGRFPALPQPLRAVLGLRANLLDVTAAELAPRLDAVTHLPTSLPVTPALFCADGFHPGPDGYRQWGTLLAAGIAAHLVDALVMSETVGVAKPDPAIFHAALRQIGRAPADAVMLGDSWAADVLGAHAAGVAAVWLNRHGRACPDPALARELRALEPAGHVAALLLGQ